MMLSFIGSDPLLYQPFQLLIMQVTMMGVIPPVVIVYIGPNLISWSSKKKPIVSLSSTEAEYRSLAHIAEELAWLRQLLKGIGIFLQFPPLIWCDNISALYLASNPIFHGHSKHIKVYYHFIRERLVCHDLLVLSLHPKIKLLIILPMVPRSSDSLSYWPSSTLFLYY